MNMFFVVEDVGPNLVSIAAQHIIISSERERERESIGRKEEKKNRFLFQ